jgi:hypothetical protein
MGRECSVLVPLLVVKMARECSFLVPLLEQCTVDYDQNTKLRVQS